MKFLFVPLCLVLATAFTGVNAEDTIRDNTSGQTYPATITVQDNGNTLTLRGTGAATRKKLIVKVYSIASYIQDGKGSVDQQLNDDKTAKQFTQRWLHNVEAEKIRNGYRESFEKSLSPEQRSQLQKSIDQFIGFFNKDAKKGDETIIRSLPGGRVEVLENGNKVGNLQDPALAKALWNLWFGPNSVVDRAQLTAQQPQTAGSR